MTAHTSSITTVSTLAADLSQTKTDTNGAKYRPSESRASDFLTGKNWEERQANMTQ